MGYTQLALALVGTGVAIKQGEDQRIASKRALTAQKAAQDQALSAAIKQDRANAEMQAMENRRKPDILGLLGAEQARSKSGAAGTLLTGPLGVAAPSMKLGRTGLLGG